MFAKFLNQDTEKQDRILNAAIKEFALKGYDNASTNEIVKEAGISKGLLFHYFKNKKHLFFFLFDSCMELMVDEFYQKIDLTEQDFFVRIHQAVEIKIELLKKFPHIIKFIELAYMEDSKEVKVELDQKRKELTEINVGKVYEGIDVSKFREDMDFHKILKIITWTIEKAGEEELNKAKRSPSHKIDYDAVFTDANEYIEMLKTCFYK